MNQTTKTILIVAAVAVVALVVYKKYMAKPATQTVSTPAPGTAQNATTAPATTGSTTGSQVSGYVDTAKGLWDDVSNLF